MHEAGAVFSACRELLGAQTHHLPALLGQAVTGKAAVQNTIGIFNFTVAHHVNNSLHDSAFLEVPLR